MYRQKLIQDIECYKGSSWCSQDELDVANQFIHFVQNDSQCFDRSNCVGHLTASCWLWNSSQTACLFTHHKKLGKWLQLGGHADGNSNLLEVALQEAKEESGLTEILPLSKQIFDLSIHNIPQTHYEEAHLHYDVRYLLWAKKDSPLVVSDESHDLMWVDFADFGSHDFDPSIIKMQQKLDQVQL